MPVISPDTLEHQSLEKPALADPLWRYMDFTKFVAMLVNKGLYLSRLDRLAVARFKRGSRCSPFLIVPRLVSLVRHAGQLNR